MRILITGVTTGLGRLAAAHLLASGHQVAGVAEYPHRDLDPRVVVTRRPLDATRLARLTDDADVVIHLAPVEPGVPESAGLTGLLQLADAAARSGTRLIVPIHAAGDPELYRQAEQLAASSWGPTLVLRLAPLVGRIADWSVHRTIATLAGDRHGTVSPVRLLHVDDLCRFLSRAVGVGRTGELDLAAPDSITYISARRLLSDVTVRRGTPLWPVPDPIFRLVPLQRDWDFECGWRPSDAVADAALEFAGRPLDDDGGAASVPAPTSGTTAAPEGMAGEFDYPIDPRFPVFGATGAPDVLPGPLTPITLDVQLGAMRAAQRTTARLLGLPPDLAAEWESRATAVFGHRVFTGTSVHDALDPKPTAIPRILRAARGWADRCASYAAAVAATERDAPTLTAMTDAQLDTRMLRLCALIQQGWELSTVGTSVEGAFNRLARRPGSLIPHPSATTSTGHLAARTAGLAALLRDDEAARALASAGDLDALRRAAPAFGSAFDAAVREVGHRGTGEAELANPVIADETGLLLAAAGLASGDGAADANRQSAEPAGRRAAAAYDAREAAWDGTARATHQLRMALREKGSRMRDAGVVDAADDVFYLTRYELLAPPPDVCALVVRRRSEQQRLQGLSLPEVFDAQWQPVEHITAPAVVVTDLADLAEAAS